MVRVLSSAFDLHNLPNRAELRLRSSGKVIGYTLSHISHSERGRHTGAALFFKDLTRVEQLVERERLRDRLVALGEMAAAIAHGQNPLAGIEVMAGLLRRQVPDSADAQSILKDIINEAKLANAIVLEALEFVRPIRLQVERTSVSEVLQGATALAARKMPDRMVDVQLELSRGCRRFRATSISWCSCSQTC